MGIPVGSAVEQSNGAPPVVQSLSASGAFTNPFTPTKPSFNLTLSGTFVATAVLERAFDNGTTWVVCTSLGSQVTFSAPATEVCKNLEPGVSYRVRLPSYSSGTVAVRLSE